MRLGAPRRLPIRGWTRHNATACPNQETHYPPHSWGTIEHCVGITIHDELLAGWLPYAVGEEIALHKLWCEQQNAQLLARWKHHRQPLSDVESEVYDSLVSSRCEQLWDCTDEFQIENVLAAAAADARTCVKVL